MTRIIGYIRVSTDQQADAGVSLDAQRAKLEAYASLYDIELVDVIVDAGKSAKTLKRPGLAQALDAMRHGKAEGMLVAKLDRLTRSVRDLGTLLDEYFCEGPGGLQLLSVAEQIDTRTAGGRLVLNVLGAVSQWEREKIGERTREALAYLKGQGVRLGADPLGFERGAAGGLVAVPAEQATLERIAMLHRDGASVRAIAAQLNAEGARTKRGGRWHPTTVQRALRGYAPPCAERAAA